ncbi:hypothetical protein [Cardinium endosymbiont of Tipula unca]|uniref:hypothetical protein n=1 Tax=Cardinium endosymbiont of Tipula unca TaxID=3066216 RepID=UPI0030D5112D
MLWKNITLFGEYGITFPDNTIENNHGIVTGLLISLSRYVVDPEVSFMLFLAYRKKGKGVVKEQ